MLRSSISKDPNNWLRFPLRDPLWKEKMATGGLISLANLAIPGLGTTFTCGYAWQLLRDSLREGCEPCLPEWRDLERIFIEGMKLFTIRLTFILPVLLASLPLTLALFIPLYWIGPDGRSLPTETVLLIVGGGLGLLLLVGLALGLALSLFTLPAVCHWVANGSFRDAFRVRVWWPVWRSNPGGFARAYLVGLGLQAAIALASLLLSLTIVLLPLVPFLAGAASTWAALVSWSLAAQAYKEGKEGMR